MAIERMRAGIGRVARHPQPRSARFDDDRGDYLGPCAAAKAIAQRRCRHQQHGGVQVGEVARPRRRLRCARGRFQTLSVGGVAARTAARMARARPQQHHPSMHAGTRCDAMQRSTARAHAWCLLADAMMHEPTHQTQTNKQRVRSAQRIDCARARLVLAHGCDDRDVLGRVRRVEQREAAACACVCACVCECVYLCERSRHVRACACACT